MPASAPGPGPVVAAHADAAPANAGGAWSEGASLRIPGDGAHAPVAGASPGTNSGTNPGGIGAQDLVAHQVAYWVQPKIQSAQLTVQREGQAVEVRVSLSGNQAHVSFGSDQPHTRELLDQGQAQLSDLLRSEGLVLSGMSVGMSAGDGAAGQGAGAPERQRAGARQAQVLALAPVGTAPLARGGGATDHAVDIFV
ncbi:flagellar hook-length control protein FliK [Verminephrobacter eiseniae]|nr:flagellar hook-length control protein FliK [Verminephrobacter eiseniae]